MFEPDLGGNPLHPWRSFDGPHFSGQPLVVAGSLERGGIARGDWLNMMRRRWI